MTSSQETDQAYSNKKPQLPEPALTKQYYNTRDKYKKHKN